MQTEDSTAKMPSPTQNKFKLPTIPWPVLGVFLVLLSSGIGFTATTMLLGLPKASNCNRIFKPLISASGRLYCAELQAEERTTDSLLAAIALVSDLPLDHPLRGQIDQAVEAWAAEILKLADEKFQEGKLAEAKSIAKKIPSHLKAYQLVAQQIEDWDKLWQEGETTFDLVDQQLRKSNWPQAFREAVKLTYLDNQYWATTKYEEAVKLITLAKEESAKLDRAYVLIRRGGVDNLLKAVENARQIPKSSYAYGEASKLISDVEDKLSNLAQGFIDRENWQDLLNLANKIPLELDLQSEVNLWSQLAKAALSAQEGTMDGLNNALIQVQDIPESSPLYEKAKNLIGLWQKEKDDLTHITKAQELAGFDTIASLTSAIMEAQLVPNYNPRYQQAQGLIREWTAKIQVIEDQPLLDQAKQLAVSDNPQIIRQAIAQASLIRQGRALYPEAQRYINQWRGRIERQEDQPILDQADSLANTDSLTAAIETAQQIKAGRVLYQEAQGKIKGWQRELNGRQLLRQAQEVAAQGGMDSLIKAINIADRIPEKTMVKSRAIASINNWSYQVLRFADSMANSSVNRAIAIANNIPPSSVAYQDARNKIKSWQNIQEENRGRQILREAANIASRGTPDALVSAINTARQVRASTEVQQDSISAINSWSQQILRIAELQASSDLREAIAIAKKVPRGTSAYSSAQNDIQSWQQLLQPVTGDTPLIQTSN